MLRQLQAGLKGLLRRLPHEASLPAAQTGWLDLCLARLRALGPQGIAQDVEQRLASAPADPEGHCAAGMVSLARNETPAALQCFEEALRLGPELAQAHFGCALAYGALGRTAEAQAALERAVRVKPDYVDALVELGCLHLAAGRYEDASDCLELALAFQADNAQARFHRARLHRKQGRLDEALPELEGLSSLYPDWAGLQYELGLAYQKAERIEAALGAFRRTVALVPDHADALVNLGVLQLNQAGDAAGARASFEGALQLKPGMVEAQANLGLALCMQGQAQEAIAYFEQRVAERPEVAEFHWNLAVARLAAGDYARGWPEYEWRKRREGGGFHRRFPYPDWNGEPLAGKTMLVYGEQGLGDEIMFASCLPGVIAQAAHCVIECHARLAGLYARSFPQTTVHGAVRDGERGWLAAHPAIGVQSAAGSLPLYLRRSRLDFPRHGGYLQADPMRVERWRKRLLGLGARRKVGIAWRGGSLHTRRLLRSIPCEQLGCLLGQTDVHWVNLQHGERAADLDGLREGFGVEVFDAPEIGTDLEETAALIMALDLVVSVANTTVHLAGALGRPVWALVPSIPEWRYRSSGDTMPWYPAVRLFRQEAGEDWRPVLDRVAAAIREALLR